MNTFLKTLILCLMMAAGCQQKADDYEAVEGVEKGDNQALYEEVMKIHDEVMPKMDELYKAKVALNTQVTNNPDMPEIQKIAISEKIAQLDSASESMMVWMRQFNPLPDSAGEEKARLYLEKEMEKVKQVKENILTALQDAKTTK